MRRDVDLTDIRIIQALAHPLRASILAELDRGQASPTVLSRRLAAPLGTVSYHVRVLAELGLISLTAKTPRRGAIEHHYESVPRSSPDAKALASLPAAARSEQVAEIARTLDAAVQGHGLSRSGAQLECRRFDLDAQGWRELAAEIAASVERVDEIKSQAEDRLQAADGESIAAVAVLAAVGLSADG